MQRPRCAGQIEAMFECGLQQVMLHAMAGVDIGVMSGPVTSAVMTSVMGAEWMGAIKCKVV